MDAESPMSHDVRGGRKFRCRTCQRSFTKSEHLARHERSHAKQKPFICPECSKEFGRQDVLTRHRRLHRNDVSRTGSTAEMGPQHLGHVSADIEVDNLSPANTLSSSTIPADEPYLGDDSSFAQTGTSSFPWWTDTDDMLDFLTSDFSNTWPMTLPVTQFQTSGYESIDPAFPSDDSSASRHNIGQGHQAMQQMSKLISVLSSNLTAEIQSTGITSSFLDTCMHVFFDKFIPSFPVLHRGTFVVKESSHPLLLNIMALGSLFVGSKDAVPKGEALWRLAHIAVATNWKHLMATKGPRDSCEGIQLVLTAVLGQTYALMSKNESLRMTSQIFHGLGFYWGRQCGMFNVAQSQPDVPSLTSPAGEKLECWRTWAAMEVRNRAVLGHYVLDGHISQFSGYAACARHTTNPLHVPSSDAAFNATTPDDWIREMLKNDGQPPSFRELFNDLFASAPFMMTAFNNSMFTARIVLEGLQSLAAENQEADGLPAIGTPNREDIARALIRFYNTTLRDNEPGSVDKMELLVRWHTIFLDLATPTTALCKKLCTTYNVSQTLHDTKDRDIRELDIVAWSQSLDGMRSIMHALAIQDIMERIPLGRTSAIHFPAAIFAVSTIYSARCISGFPTIAAPSRFTWEEIWDLPSVQGGENIQPGHMSSFLNYQHNPNTPDTITKNLMYELNSLQVTLGSISSRWGVSHEMDGILNRWMSIAAEQHPTSI